MPYPQTASPRYFSGQLTAKTVDCCAGLHRMEVHLLDDEGNQHVVYLAYGRGAAAAQYAQHQFDSLGVGFWYHGSATMMRKSRSMTEWAGHVPPLQLCQRRHRFAAPAITQAAAEAAA